MIWLTLLFLLCSRQQQDEPKPPIGIIDFYGLKSVSETQARDALGIKEGDSPPDSTKEAQRRLEAIPGVAQARLNFVCCEAGKVILYVGVKERGAPTLQFRPAPNGAIRLPRDIIDSSKAYENALEKAILSGDVAEDDSQGHTLTHNPDVRKIQESYITYAKRDLNRLREVLRNSADAEQRAVAAQVMAYTPNKREVVDDLVAGMRDPSGDVRNNSMRALEVMASLKQIQIPIGPFIAMLDSIVWTDLNKSSLALYKLTADRNPLVLDKLRQQALPTLVDMARWKSPGHAFAAFFLLGRIAGLPENEIQKTLDSGARDAVINAALKRMK